MNRYRVAALFVCMTVPAMAQPPAPGPVCLQQINIHDFQPVPGNRSLVITDRARRRYRVNFMGPCHNLQFHLGLRIKSFGGNLSCVSRGDSITVRDVATPGQCVIKSVEYQTPALDQSDAQLAAAKQH